MDAAAEAMVDLRVESDEPSVGDASESVQEAVVG